MSPDLIYSASTWVLPLLIAITMHEAVHGFVASLDDARASDRRLVWVFSSCSFSGTLVSRLRFSAATQPFKGPRHRPSARASMTDLSPPHRCNHGGRHFRRKSCREYQSFRPLHSHR